MSATFEHRDLGRKAIEREVRLSRKLVALVGIPGDAQSPQDAEGNPASINMASLAYIMEKGSPVNNIPARPFMEQTRQKSMKEVMGLMARLQKAISNGSLTAMAAIKRLGAAYEEEMKAIFTTGTFAPNSPITINGGWMRNRVSGKAFKVKGKGSSRPLVDTTRLRQSIIFKVAKV
jgi:hypothetical protein